MTRLSFVYLLLTPAMAFPSPIVENRPPVPQQGAKTFDPTMKFLTEGSIGPTVCFRFGGLLQSRQEIYGLKRSETAKGPVFLLGDTEVTEFPEWIFLEVWLRQEACPKQKGKQRQQQELSAEILKEVNLELAWKSGLHERPVEEMRFKGFETLPDRKSISLSLFPDIAAATWRGVISVKSAGVPLTDSLVIVLRTKEGDIAARTSARF